MNLALRCGWACRGDLPCLGCGRTPSMNLNGRAKRPDQGRVGDVVIAVDLPGRWTSGRCGGCR